MPFTIRTATARCRFLTASRRSLPTKTILRLNMEVVGEFRNTSSHFVTDEYEPFYGPILQECVKFYEEKLRELHGIEISDRIPENYLALYVRRGDVDYDVIKARYPREVVEKMLELGSSIVASRSDGARIGYATELRLTKKKGEGIPVRIASDADAAVSILHSLTDPINKYIYRTKKGTDFIRRKLKKEGIVLKVKGEPKAFNDFHFRVFVDFYNMKGNDAYSYNLSLHDEQPSWGYSQQAIDLILQEIRRDPEHVIDSMRAELSKRRSKKTPRQQESRPQEQGNSKRSEDAYPHSGTQPCSTQVGFSIDGFYHGRTFVRTLEAPLRESSPSPPTFKIRANQIASQTRPN